MARRKTGVEPAVRMHQALARDLGTAILSGEFRPGDCFEGEIERSEALGVSRTVYREAIRILVAKGLVESKPKAGTHVTPRSRWNLLDPDVLAWTFSGEPDDHFIKGLFELRGIVEPAAAELAALRRTPAQLDRMADALERMGTHGLATEAGRLGDQDFHGAILDAADNEALASLTSSVGAAVSWTTRFKQREQALPRDPLPDHVRVYEAIRASDRDTAKVAMKDLLALALADMGLALDT